MDLAKLQLQSTRCWTWSLHANQAYLGRIVLSLRRDCQGSLADLTDVEWEALRTELRAYEEIARDLFRPDRFNYKQLGNEWPHVHVHAIPRYRSSRRWNDVEFVDHRWGQDPYPDVESPLTADETYRLAEWMRERIVQDGRYARMNNPA